MIIVSTPYRVSFFGGGTDLPAWYEQHGGEVLSCTINHFSWLACRYLPPFFENKHRVVWSKLEMPSRVDDIEHNAVRGALKWLRMGEDKGLEITVMSDLPARAGLGSSSTFAVGLLNALHTLRRESVDKKQLAEGAIHLERVLLEEAGGIQDQIASAYGGLNHIQIANSGDFSVTPLSLKPEREKALQDHMMLFFSGVSRTAARLESEKVKSLRSGGKSAQNLHEIGRLVGEAKKVLLSEQPIDVFGQLLHETWLLKRDLASGIAPTFIDEMYAAARKAGATGGKLLGAGGGGFFLVFAPPEKHEAIKKALANMIYVPLEFEHEGSRIIMQDFKYYSDAVYARRDFIHLKDRAKQPVEVVE